MVMKSLHKFVLILETKKSLLSPIKESSCKLFLRLAFSDPENSFLKNHLFVQQQFASFNKDQGIVQTLVELRKVLFGSKLN